MEQTVRARAVIFDMDGTLVDSNAVVEAIWTIGSPSASGCSTADVLAFSHGRQTIDTVRRFAPADADHEALAAELASMEIQTPDGIVEVPGACDVRRLDPRRAHRPGDVGAARCSPRPGWPRQACRCPPSSYPRRT